MRRPGGCGAVPAARAFSSRDSSRDLPYGVLDGKLLRSGNALGEASVSPDSVIMGGYLA
jgi:hypothetical protein